MAAFGNAPRRGRQFAIPLAYKEFNKLARLAVASPV